jgi:hypothetical protein
LDKVILFCCKKKQDVESCCFFFFFAVWKAKWNDLTDVAVKWLLTDNAHDEFLAEIAVLRKVRHPHVIETFGVSVDSENRLRLVRERERRSRIVFFHSQYQRSLNFWTLRCFRICEINWCLKTLFC